jgi:hypothetical protein
MFGSECRGGGGVVGRRGVVAVRLRCKIAGGRIILLLLFCFNFIYIVMALKVLELFSGTGSVGKVAKSYGFDVLSLDLIMDADIKADILLWDYKEYPPNYFYYIHASPPCVEYSRPLTTRPRNIEAANEIVLKTLEILYYFKPTYFTMENPQTGLLKDQPFMAGIPYNDVDYCKYGLPYRKRTRIWNNIGWVSRPLCKLDCGSIVEGTKRHKQIAQRLPHGKKSDWGADFQQQSKEDLYRIPHELISEWFLSII